MLWTLLFLFRSAVSLNSMDCYNQGLLLSGGACIPRCPQGTYAGQYECYSCSAASTIQYTDGTFTITAPQYLQTKSAAFVFGTFSVAGAATVSVTVKANYGNLDMTTYTGLTFTSTATDPTSVPVQVLSFSGTAANVGTAMSTLRYTPIQYFISPGTTAMTNSVDTVLVSFSDGSGHFAHIEMRVILGSAKDPSSCECTMKNNGLVCNGHGTCDWQSPSCTCLGIYSGTYCEKDFCAACVDGVGMCTVSTASTCTCGTSSTGESRYGDRCQYQNCPASCSSNGSCDRTTGICTCFEGYFGHDCSQLKCINDCSGHGRCVAGACTCYLGFFGPDCSGIQCPRDCGANGGCDYTTGKCKCSGSYTDADCMFTVCASTVANGICDGHGDCDYKTGMCSCYSGYSGVDCSYHYFTLEGTNTYIVGTGRKRLLIDTGQGVRQYLANLKQVVEKELAIEGFEGIVLTHSHIDHITGATDVLRTWGPMPIFKFRENDEPPELLSHIRYLEDSQEIHTEGASLLALHTPGYALLSHKEDHLCFWLSQENSLFTGDIVMGRGSVPLTQTTLNQYSDYRASMQRLHALRPRLLYPSHGPTPVPGLKVSEKQIEEDLRHRRQRELQVVGCLQVGKLSLDEIVVKVYGPLPRELREAASRCHAAANTLQYIAELVRRKELVETEPGVWQLP